MAGDFDNVKYSFSLEGKLRFIFIARLKCDTCKNIPHEKKIESDQEVKVQSRFDSVSPFFFDRLPLFIREKFPMIFGLKRGVFAKEFLKAAHSLRVGFHLPVNSIHLVHRECISNNLLTASTISFSLVSHILKMSILPQQQLVTNLSVITPVLWKRDHELAVSTWRINRYLIRELSDLELYYIASFKSLQCKILRYDHTFKVASLIQVVKKGENSFDHDQTTPYSAILTTMNEDQKIPFFSFVVSKSLNEVEDSLISLSSSFSHLRCNWR